jgi:phytanoyl-CoA hydroxylase
MSVQMSLKKFSVGDENSIRDYYSSQGYVVIENLLSHAKIKNLIGQYESVKHSKFFIFFSQDTHLPTQPKLTSEGFIQNSMLNPADLKLWKSMRVSLMS